MSLAEVTMTVIRYVISLFLSFDITVTSAQTVHQIINDNDLTNGIWRRTEYSDRMNSNNDKSQFHLQRAVATSFLTRVGLPVCQKESK